MGKRGIAAVLAVLLLIGTAWAGSKGAARAEVEAVSAARDLVYELLGEMIAASGESSLQGWVDHALTENAGGTGGWVLMALRRLEQLETRGQAAGEPRVRGTDFRGPAKTLEAALAEDGGSVTQRERMALTLRALGGGDKAARETLEAALEETTLMPLVFALHLANNLPDGAAAGKDAAAKILALQLADGGWAVIGDTCDVDCTAMTLQALTPLRGDPEIAAAVKRGAAALRGVQLENGGFTGMGLESAESCAQALLALSDLGLAGAADFRRPGGSVPEAMLRFRLPGSGFAHSLGGPKNDTATVQCFYALVGYLSSLSGGAPYYLFDFETPEAARAFRPEEIPVRTWLFAAAAALTLGGWILAAVRRKKNWRSYLFPLLVGALVAAVAAGTEIQSPESFYRQRPAREGERQAATRISIRCDSVAGQSEYAPADGVILPETTVMIAEGETAFDQLAEAVRSHRIQMEYDGTVAGAYVRGIGYLYEYAFGNLSGWMYRVNGVFADVGCAQYPLREGDLVEWVYSVNLGKDAETAQP